MSTTPTNQPVPSEKPQDLKFNAGKIDEFVNSMARQYIDRFCHEHYTIEGIRWVAQQAIAAFGYITMDSFEDGNTLTLPNQILRLEDSGEYYRWDGSFPKVVPIGSTPESTGGVGPGAWMSVGDASARQWAETVFRALPVARAQGSFQSGGVAESNSTALLNTQDGFYYTPVSGTITVPSGSAPDSNWKCIGLLNGYDFSDVRNWVIDFSDADANTAILQLMADSQGDGGSIIVPGGVIVSFNILWIKNRFFTISGNGTIDGTLRICKGSYASSSDIYMNFSISGVRFKTDRNLKDAIQLIYARVGDIQCSGVEGYDNFIRVIATSELPNPKTYGQMVNRIKIHHCAYGGNIDNIKLNYLIYAEESDGIDFPVADWIVESCEGHVNISHIHLNCAFDGFTVANCIKFFQGHQDKSTTKKSHFRAEKGGAWLHVHDNKLFESGDASIYLNGVSRYSVHDNLYAFGSQRVPAAQIVVDGTPSAGEYFSHSNIHDETIISPAGEGVAIGAKQGGVKVHDITTMNPSSSDYYYGSALQPAANGLVINSDTRAIEVYRTTVREGGNSFPLNNNNIYQENVIDKISGGFGFIQQSIIRELIINSPTSAIDISSADEVHFNTQSEFSLSSILNSNGVRKVITFVNYGASNVTIVSGSNIKLAGSVNATLTQMSSITRSVSSDGFSSEISRAII